jgi:indolepyruvate ferredoxin oxidoreductase
MDDRARAAAEPLAGATLADRFDLDKSRVLLSGAQAIVRLLLSQKARDRRAGLNTGGFVSGYRGSPLGGLDLQFYKIAALFAANDIHFEPGLNEELAATAIWGAQQAELRGEGRFDGVFGLWYGKGPGVDRSGDAFRHANLAGTSRCGGVLALMGDDATAESSTTAHQSEFAFVDAMMPILAPAGVQEILDYGALGWGLSRYAGVWVGLKCVKDTVESTAVVDGSLDRVEPVEPMDFPLPPGGLAIRRVDGVLAQEERLHEHKLPAVVAWLAANRLDRLITTGGAAAKLGIVTAGKPYLDVRQALDALGLDEARCDALGLRLTKLACVWPVEPEGLKAFAAGLDEIVVVEEKRALIETQLREILYGVAHPPVVVGKRDEAGQWLLPSKGALDPQTIAVAIGERLMRLSPDPALAAALARIKATRAALASLSEAATRTPYFCSGCPHNRSTMVPEGARAYAGIGCHFMALFMDRATEGFTQMGGEGANWIGEAHFSTRRHVFQNLGDGTYNHSGALALRWAIDAKVNLTYKILFNDAVAMTGGQRHEGGLNPPQIAAQVAADGAKRIVVVADDVGKYPPATRWPEGVVVRPRDELIAVEKDLAAIDGVTVLIYDQTCAAEKRRRRKRGQYPDPDKRVFINPRVCEGCGDCGVKSNCVSVQPLETEFGRKRRIDQTACNKDYSCVDGFCPSFVTIEGARPKARAVGIAPPPWRGDGRRHHRNGGASRRQGRGGDRHGRPGAKGRRGVQPRQDRGADGRYPRGEGRRRRSRPRARRRSRRDGRQIGAGGDARRRHRRRRRQRRTVPRRLHPPARLRPAGRADQGVDPGALRRRRALHRSERSGFGAIRRDGERQHGPARRRLSGGAAAGRRGGAQAGDRTQRRSDGNQSFRLRLGPRARGRSVGARRLHAPGGAPGRRQPRSVERTARRVPDRLPGSRLCRTLPRRRRLGGRGRAPIRAGRRRLRARGRSRPVQADGLQGRI